MGFLQPSRSSFCSPNGLDVQAQDLCAVFSQKTESGGRWGMISVPCSHAVTTALSSPWATAMRPRCLSALSSRLSSWRECVSIGSTSFAVIGDGLLVGRLERLQNLDLCEQRLSQSPNGSAPSFPEFIVERCPILPIGTLSEDREADGPSVLPCEHEPQSSGQAPTDVVDDVSHDDGDHLICCSVKWRFHLSDPRLRFVPPAGTASYACLPVKRLTSLA